MRTAAGNRAGLPAPIAEPAELRARCRSGRFDGPTAGQAPGRVQANLMVVPRTHAYDFAVFCQRNPKPCPLLDITDPGDPTPRAIAADADVLFFRQKMSSFRCSQDVAGRLAEPEWATIDKYLLKRIEPCLIHPYLHVSSN